MDKNEERKKRLNKHCAEFVKTIQVKTILCHFPKMPEGTKEEILCCERNDGSQAAAYMFLMKMTKADSDWYDFLMEALKSNDCYSELRRKLQDDDNVPDNQHPLADSSLRTSQQPTYPSSSTNRLEQTVSSPHQEMTHSYASASGVEPHMPEPPETRQSTMLPYERQQTVSSQRPQLSTNSNPHVATHDHSAMEFGTEHQQQGIPSSPKPHTRHSEDYHQDQENAEVFHREPVQLNCVNELTLGQVHQGVREAFNIKMNHSIYKHNNWKSLAEKLNMTVDEVDTIQDAPQLYDRLRTRGMKLVELVQYLREMGRVDLISDINKYHDLSEMNLSESESEQSIERPCVSRQTSTGKTKQEQKLKRININLPDAERQQIIGPMKDVSIIGEHFNNIQPEKAVKMGREDLISDINTYPDLSEMNLSESESEQPIERPCVSRQTSTGKTKQEQKLKRININLPDAESQQIIGPMKDVSIIGEHFNNIQPEKPVKKVDKGIAEPVVERSSPAQKIASRNGSGPTACKRDAREPSKKQEEKSGSTKRISDDAKAALSNVKKLYSSAASEGELSMPFVGTSDPRSLNPHNQPPINRNIEQSGSYVPESVQRAQGSVNEDVIENVGQHVEEMEVVAEDAHEEDDEEEAGNLVYQNADSRSEESSVDPPRYASAEAVTTNGISRSTVVAAIVDALAMKRF